MESIESVGAHFDLNTYLKARSRAIEATHKVASLVKVGMSEEDGHKIIDAVLEEFGAEKKWHPNKFRIGKNTLKSFKEKSDPKVRLKENDLFFIDIGPVFDGHEADYGETFSFGSDQKYLKIAQDVKKAFAETKECWEIYRPRGHELYEYLKNRVTHLGYELNLKMNGHRLGDFPHAVYFKGKLGDIEKCPAPNLWVLEVLIRHPQEDFGAFFEDILLS